MDLGRLPLLRRESRQRISVLSRRQSLVSTALTERKIQLVEREGALALSAYIDLEGARIGPTGFDHAMLWSDLLLQGQHRPADDLLCQVLCSSDADFVAGTLVNAGWLFAMRTGLEHPEQKRAVELAPTVQGRLADAVLRHRRGGVAPA